MILNRYLRLEKELAAEVDRLTIISRVYGYSRLLIVLGALYTFYRVLNGAGSLDKGIFTLLVVVGFISIYIHGKVSRRRKYISILLGINQEEIKILKGEESNHYDGGTLVESEEHNYAEDLNIYGPNSIYKLINRTASYIGELSLFKLFLSIKSPDRIVENQDAVKELTEDVEWRQRLSALLQMDTDSDKIYSSLIRWGNQELKPISKVYKLLSYISPVLLIVSIALYWIGSYPQALSLIISLYIFNNLLFALQYGRLVKEFYSSGKIDRAIKSYGQAIKHIESREFSSKRLIELQKILKRGGYSTSEEIKTLSKRVGELDSIANLVVVLFLDGLFLYHIHSYYALQRWHKKYGGEIEMWLETIGEVEVLSSLANLSYNNPDFVFPELNSSRDITFENLGHPLIDSSKRICSSIEFTSHKFMVLTGSNMSGKSTFLRSIGVNMVLGGVGSPVCSTSANIHPLDIFVAMKVSDSLSENESYFFAEIKRLKRALDHIEKRDTLVLFDEILRGTNSDDKREGTVQLLKQLVKRGAIGAVATHDLEVCATSEEFPNYIKNRCFEVETVNNEQVFDYKLKSGVCQNKNAIFLMERVGIIPMSQS